MLDIKWIRENPEALDRALVNRRQEPASAKLIQLDEARRAAIQKLEEAQARRNAASKEIGAAKAKKDEAAAARVMAEVASLKDVLPELEAAAKAADKALEDALAVIPNVPQADVPVGNDEHGNKLYRTWGEPPNQRQGWGNAFQPKQHYELGEAIGDMDFAAAAKLSGSRFVVLKRGLARLERALGQFMLDLHTEEHGYTEVQPPVLVLDQTMRGTAQLPKFHDDQFVVYSHPDFLALLRRALDRHQLQVLEGLEAEVGKLGSWEKATQILREQYKILDIQLGDDEPFYRKWLIPTAEVPLTNLVRESILAEDELPLRFTALTPCFRSEAGAAGKDTRGMLRQHQFDKVELVSITTPEKSADEHERMLTCAEEVLKRLDLHYRIMTLCTGDMGFASQKTYDIEVWLPGQGAYREISYCSVCGEFQARRMGKRPNEGVRYRGKDGKIRGHVHTLNGSGVAVGRALIAVMETYQQADGSIAVPDVLQPYMGGVKVVGG